MRHSNASERFKALVAARLLMGQFDRWEVFEQERAAARQVVNRRAARSVSTQIGRSARDLSTETQAFILRILWTVITRVWQISAIKSPPGVACTSDLTNLNGSSSC